MKNILSLIILVLTTIFLTTSVFADVPSSVVQVQWAIPAGTPSAPSGYEQKWFVWDLLSDLFTATAKIKSQYILAFQNIYSANNNIPRWNAGTRVFNAGIMNDNGSRVLVWWDLRINGELNNNGIVLDPNSPWPWSLWSQNNSNAYRTTGNVGIGTSNPTHKLDIRWGVRVDHTSSTYDLWIQWWSAATWDNRNLAILGRSENNGDRLYVNYNNEYRGGVQIWWNVHVPGKITTTTPTRNNHVTTKWYVDSRLGRISNYSEHSLYLWSWTSRDLRLWTKDLCVYSGSKTWADDSNMYDGCRVRRRTWGVWYLELRKSSDPDGLRCYASCMNL